MKNNKLIAKLQFGLSAMAEKLPGLKQALYGGAITLAFHMYFIYLIDPKIAWKSLLSVGLTIFIVHILGCNYRISHTPLKIAFTFLAFFSYMNLIYARNYSSAIPIQTYFAFYNLKGLGPSIWYSIRWYDLGLLLPVILYLKFWHADHSVNPTAFSRPTKAGLLVLYILAITLLLSPRRLFTLNWARNAVTLAYRYDSMHGLKCFGVPGFWLYSITGPNTRTVNPEDVNAISRYLGKPRTVPTGLRPPIKNVILIIVESLESWPINLRISSKELTPKLNNLINKEESFYFSTVIPQVKDGRSSDCQFIINTGLLPCKDGAVFIEFFNNIYPTFGHALKYNHFFKQSITMIGGEPSFWNQAQMTPTLGFDQLLSRKDFQNKRTFLHGMLDEDFFNEVTPRLLKLEQPFYCQLVTLTSHLPFEIPNDLIRIQIPEAPDRRLANYIQAIHYADYALGRFIDDLKQSPLWHNSVLIITGDHDAFPPADRATILTKPGARSLIGDYPAVPLIFVNTGYKGAITAPIGQIDIYPTLIEALKIQSTWPGLGISRLPKSFDHRNLKGNRTIIFDGHSTETNTHRAQAEVNVSDTIIRSNYFLSHPEWLPMKYLPTGLRAN